MERIICVEDIYIFRYYTMEREGKIVAFTSRISHLSELCLFARREIRTRFLTTNKSRSRETVRNFAKAPSRCTLNESMKYEREKLSECGRGGFFPHRFLRFESNVNNQ